MNTPLPDAEKLIRDAAAAAFPSASVLTEMTADITGPTIRVNVIGGTNRFVLDKPVLDWDVVDMTRTDARALAIDFWNWLVFTLPGTNRVTTTETVARPHARPYGNTKVRRFGGTQRLYIR